MTASNVSQKSRIQVAGLPWKWDTLAGDESTWESTMARPAAGEPMEVFKARVQHTDLVLTSFLKPADQIPQLNRWRADVDKGVALTVSRQFLDDDDVPIPGAVSVWTGCAIKGIAVADHDANSSEVTKVTMTLQVGEFSA